MPIGIVYVCFCLLLSLAHGCRQSDGGINMSFINDIRVGTTGLKNYQNKLDVISNNVSNASTIGFRRSKVTFIESFQSIQSAAVPNSGNTSFLEPTTQGYGLVGAQIDLDMKPGEYTRTGNLLDLAVKDDGYFIVEREDRQLYTRDGNLAIDANKHVVQETNGAFIKGFAATMNGNGTTTIDTQGPLEKVQFDKVESIPFKPTTNLIFASNLDHESHVRSLEVGNPTVNITDRYEDIQNIAQSIERIDPDQYEISLLHKGEEKLKLQVYFNDLGDILNWEISGGDNIETQTDERGLLRTITFFYDSVNKDGETVKSPMTVTLPKVSTTTDVTMPAHLNISSDAIKRNIDLNLRPGIPTEQGYGTMPVGTFNSVFVGGRVHTTETNLIDNEGQVHSAGITFEHVDKKTNTWYYRTSLPVTDPLIQLYLQDEDNLVLNPDRPSLLDLEEANQAIFGDTRRGEITFSENGFINKAISYMPALATRPADIERLEVGIAKFEIDDPEITRKLPTKEQIDEANEAGIEIEELEEQLKDELVNEEELEFQVFAKRKGLGAFYELILPANHKTIQEMARRPYDPEKVQVADPDSITEDELSKLNEELFNGSNQGTIFFNDQGRLQEAKSNIPEIKGTINNIEFTNEVPLTAFDQIPTLIPSTGALKTGNLRVNYDLDLVTGFGGPFSTAVRETDGYEAGNLMFTSITSTGDGTLQGRYTNGQERDIGQIGLAIFRNANGLSKEGGNLFSLSANAGFDENSIGAPNSATRGLILNQTLELSNVDLPTEFTELLITQRSYQANSKAISTSDAALQTAINIKR
tara:strand:+ start:5522 stop:7957 length:2436 start_codon:yes stop_codon:yes gene_type:complete